MQPQEVGATEWLANLSVGTIVALAFALTVIRLALAPSRSVAARAVAELVESLIIAGVLVFLIIRPFFLQAFFIPSESMEPTLMGHQAGLSPTGVNHTDTINDHIFVNKLLYRFREPRRGEIIVFRAEKKADVQGGMQTEHVLIKRLIGVPGDTIEVRPDPGGEDVVHVWRNGKELREPYVKEPMRETPLAQFATRGPLTLGPGQLFVMGDNRNNSNDSRFWGPLPRSRVIGKASFIFWPLSRIGLIR
ncbi:MAG: signal peptidase I [Chthonomonadales bacterium]|nr:signal peptidase I [Chthonomonadales bacterium]